MARLEGRVAIVTASSEGIGYAIAQRLARDGARVMISSRKQNNVDSAVKQLQAENLNVTGMVCHAGKDDHRKALIEETVKKFGQIDLLVCNAAINPAFGNILSTTDDQWDKMFDINVKSTFKMCRDVFPHMEKQGKGSIVVVSTGAIYLNVENVNIDVKSALNMCRDSLPHTEKQGNRSVVSVSPSDGYAHIKGMAAYGVTKTALHGLIKALAQAASGTNIRVNCIAPGLIKTKFGEVLWRSGRNSDFVDSLLIKRLGTPEDCAGAAAFLLSDDANYITGETVVIGGRAVSRL